MQQEQVTIKNRESNSETFIAGVENRRFDEDSATNFLMTLNDIKQRHKENHTSGGAARDEELHKLQARFLALHQTEYIGASSARRKEIFEKVKSTISAQCLSINSSLNPLQTFVHYTFHATSWRSKEFALDLKLAIKQKIRPEHYTSWVKTNGSIIDGFTSAASDLFLSGKRYRDLEYGVQEAAIKGLSRILGIVNTWYDGATKEEKSKMLAHVKHQCRANGFGSSDRRSTIFHALSKMFRGSTRQQASADAIVLQRAHRKNITEHRFKEWVKKLGGLAKIIKAESSNKKTKAQEIGKPDNQEQRPTSPTKVLASLDASEVPKGLKELRVGRSYPALLLVRVDGRIDVVVDEAVRGEAIRDEAARDEAARDEAARDEAARDEAARDEAVAKAVEAKKREPKALVRKVTAGKPGHRTRLVARRNLGRARLEQLKSSVGR